MSDLLTHIERSELVDVDLDKEPRCESICHPESGDARWHSGPAAYWQAGPCVHTTGLRCAQVVSSYLPYLPISCEICGVDAPYDVYRFIEL